MKEHSIKLRTFRFHLTILGYLAYSFSTVYFGIHPWAECLTIDKIISVTAVVFILQSAFMKANDLDIRLRQVQLAAVILFIYVHFFR